jgi:hypothetical protein
VTYPSMDKSTSVGLPCRSALRRGENSCPHCQKSQPPENSSLKGHFSSLLLESALPFCVRCDGDLNARGLATGLVSSDRSTGVIDVCNALLGEELEVPDLASPQASDT